MVLSDTDLKRRVSDESDEFDVTPFEPSNVEPASLDLRVGDEFVLLSPSSEPYDESLAPIDLREDDSETPFQTWFEREGSVTLDPGDFCLATTMESVTMPDDCCAQVTGRSSVGRLGLSIHQTAGFIDPGFEGEITLELVNNYKHPLRIHSEQRLAQLMVFELSSPADSPYDTDSQYQQQSGPTKSGLQFD